MHTDTWAEAHKLGVVDGSDVEPQNYQIYMSWPNSIRCEHWDDNSILQYYHNDQKFLVVDDYNDLELKRLIRYRYGVSLQNFFVQPRNQISRSIHTSYWHFEKNFQKQHWRYALNKSFPVFHMWEILKHLHLSRSQRYTLNLHKNKDLISFLECPFLSWRTINSHRAP